MAQTFTTAAMGAAANDGSGNKLRAGGLKIAADLAELYGLVASLSAYSLTPASLIRSRLATAATGANGQVITFSSEFVTVYALQIIDYNGIGIDVVSQDETGFVINSLSAGNFGYVALIEY